ncbi:lysophospholipid acyltransferase family protein [Nocardioides sp.]|uniref:lysophospholipid acyltransferase family protein n=1 Tax=Nocardioides sp. TaxID=35761 RepID=UPI0025E23F7A|nr:lysophospholipid acyltransferase family protein [Nocardioides sp.]
MSDVRRPHHDHHHRHHLLPASAAKHPPRVLINNLRRPARFVVRRRFEVTTHGTEHVPSDGPVILASNHVGIADGPLLAIFSPRPVHVLTKKEMFDGRLGRFLLSSGQLPLDRFNSDPAAVKACLRVLRDGGMVGIFPEGARGSGEFHRFHRGTAYLGLVSGAPIVPVIQFGTREPGAGSSALPRRGGHVELVYGPPYTFDPMPWPRTKQTVEEASRTLRDAMVAHLDHARELTGRTLPGPIPAAKDKDSEPDTSIPK